MARRKRKSGLGTVRHDASRAGAAGPRMRKFKVEVEVYRAVKGERGPFTSRACIASGKGHKSTLNARCAHGEGRGPTSATGDALEQIGRHLKRQ